MTDRDHTPSHIQVPTSIVNLWCALEETVRAIADNMAQAGGILSSLSDVRQDLEDAAVRQKLESDRLGNEAIARITAQDLRPNPDPDLHFLDCIAAMEQSARMVVDAQRYTHEELLSAVSLLEAQLNNLAKARKNAKDTQTPRANPQRS